MLIGTYVLALFGISLPVVRIGGGLLVAATAWHMLHHTEDGGPGYPYAASSAMHQQRKPFGLLHAMKEISC
jgi:multiple antibiotic resistance protein